MTVGDRWSNLPGGARWSIALVAFVVGYGLVYALVASVAPKGWGDGAIRATIVALTIPLFLLGVAQQRRRLGGRGQLGLYRRAFKTGRVPDGADRDSWLVVVRRQERYFREGRVFYRVVWAAMVVMLLGLIVLVLSTEPSIWWIPVVMLLLAVPFLWWLDRLWGRRRDQFQTLLRELEGDDATSAPSRT